MCRIQYNKANINSNQVNHGGSMLKIAIVDDDSVFLNQTELILINTLNRRQCDFSLSKYFSAEEFLNDKNNININIAILDIELNDMNGIELSKTLYTLKKKTIFQNHYSNFPPKKQVNKTFSFTTYSFSSYPNIYQQFS